MRRLGLSLLVALALSAAVGSASGRALGPQLSLRVQARCVLAVRPDRVRQGARQLGGARAEGEAREGASDRAGPDALAGPFRRADLGTGPNKGQALVNG